jgi:hypothetical protein
MSEQKTFGAFNTGRHYTAAGQRIGWCIAHTEFDPDYVDGTFDRHTVVFFDIDRMINGVIEILGPVTRQNILTEYDYSRYGYPNTEALRMAERVAVQAARDL